MAKVSVMFDKKTYIRTRTSLKVTFSDKLAAFGKFFEWPVYQKNQTNCYLCNSRWDIGTVYWNEYPQHD